MTAKKQKRDSNASNASKSSKPFKKQNVESSDEEMDTSSKVSKAKKQANGTPMGKPFDEPSSGDSGQDLPPAPVVFGKKAGRDEVALKHTPATDRPKVGSKAHQKAAANDDDDDDSSGENVPSPLRKTPGKSILKTPGTASASGKKVTVDSSGKSPFRPQSKTPVTPHPVKGTKPSVFVPKTIGFSAPDAAEEDDSELESYEDDDDMDSDDMEDSEIGEDGLEEDEEEDSDISLSQLKPSIGAKSASKQPGKQTANASKSAAINNSAEVASDDEDEEGDSDFEDEEEESDELEEGEDETVGNTVPIAKLFEKPKTSAKNAKVSGDTLNQLLLEEQKRRNEFLKCTLLVNGKTPVDRKAARRDCPLLMAVWTTLAGPLLVFDSEKSRNFMLATRKAGKATKLFDQVTKGEEVDGLLTEAPTNVDPLKLQLQYATQETSRKHVEVVFPTATHVESVGQNQPFTITFASVDEASAALQQTTNVKFFGTPTLLKLYHKL